MKAFVKFILSVCMLSLLLLLFAFCSKNEEIETENSNNNTTNTEDTISFDAKEVLIAYFSCANHVPEGTDGVSGATNKAGNTQTVAYYIEQQIGGDIFEIIPERNYPVSHSDCSAIAQQEVKDNARPTLVSHVEDMEKYSIVFVGFPIWVYREPMAVLTFLDEYDFKGKTVIPFCTSMAVGIEQSMDDFRNTIPDADIKQGLRLGYTLSGDWQSLVNEWLNKISTSK